MKQTERRQTATTAPGTGPVMAQGYLDSKQAAAYLNWSTRFLSKKMADRSIPFLKLGRRCVRFARTDLDKAMDRFRIEAVGGAR